MKDCDIESCLMEDFLRSVERNEGVCRQGQAFSRSSCQDLPHPHPQGSTYIKGGANEALVTHEVQEEENTPKESA